MEKKSKIKRIAVLTSGGDAPGMNAAIRAVVRCGIEAGLEVYGIYNGYLGMYEGKIERMTRKSVSEKLDRGGTFLGTARLPEFKNEEVRLAAIENLTEYGIQGLVAIGGDGTYRGALSLSKMGIKVVGIPGTIDNDIAGTDFTIGFDTAVNTAVDAVDKLRDTSSSHHRCSVVEVMGRNCGDIAVWTGLAVGAEVVISKETGYNEEEVLSIIRKASLVKKHAIVIVAENLVDINELAKTITENTQFAARATVLGHIQRGGSPTARDRVLASLMGVKAVDELINGASGVCICHRGGSIVSLPIEEALASTDERILEKYEAFKKLF